VFRQQRSAGSWPTHHRGRVRSKAFDQCADERFYGRRIGEQSTEVEPEVAVISRFETEMPAPSGDELKEAFG
jgi:hypothetical protein